MRRFAVAVAAAVATATQVLWASPGAPSAVDLSTSPLPYLPWLSLFALLMTAAWLTVLPRRLHPAMQLTIASLALAVYWLLLNYHEFSVRVAAWSTFSAPSLWLHVLKASALPITACTAAFVFITHSSLGAKPPSESIR